MVIAVTSNHSFSSCPTQNACVITKRLKQTRFSGFDPEGILSLTDAI